MDLNHLCLGCLEDKGEAPGCPSCGFIEGTPAESPAHLPPGTILNEKLLIGRALGQGGFGITYLAWDLNLNIKLAIKEYYPQDLASRTVGQSQVSAYSGSLSSQYEYGLEKFLQEARTLAQFEGHPSIVSVRDFFKANQTAYIVMSYIEGVTLKGYLKHSGNKLPFDKAMNIMMPVLDALHEVHGVNVLHRDVSPDNIFINRKGQVILIDFGAARQSIKDKGRSLSIILKPGFTPEEQYRSKGVQGPWTDIYAAAATMYRMITGQMPPESLDRLEEDTLEPPSRLGTAIEENQERALLKAMAVRGAGRFQTVREFQQALLEEASVQEETKEEVQEKDPTPSPQPPSSPPPPPPLSQPPPPGPPSSDGGLSEAQPGAGTSGAAVQKRAVSPKKNTKYVLIAVGLLGTLSLLGILVFYIIGSFLFNLDEQLVSFDNNDSSLQVENNIGDPTQDSNSSGQGQVQEHQPGQVSEVVNEIRGNTTGNIVNGGLVAQQGEWIYFSNPNDMGSIYKMKKDGSDYSRINNDNSSYINVAGDWIYYSNYDDDNRIYRIKTDGSERAPLSDHSWATYINVVDDWIYYTGYQAGEDAYINLYKMRTDGSELISLRDSFSGYFDVTEINVIGGWIYYSDMNSIYKMRTDGSEETIISGDGAINLNVVGDWIYYINLDDNYTIYKIRTDGSGRVKLNSYESDSLNVDNDKVYFINWEDDNSIYRMRTDGSELSRIYYDNSFLINIVDEWVYFVRWLEDEENEKLYRISPDGSQVQYLE